MAKSNAYAFGTTQAYPRSRENGCGCETQITNKRGTVFHCAALVGDPNVNYPNTITPVGRGLGFVIWLK